MTDSVSLKWLSFHALSAFVAVTAASAQGRFGQAPVYPLGGTVFSAVTTDLNHDGRTDMVALVTPATGETKAGITVTLATSAGAYPTPKVISTLPANTTGYLAAGDFNHDGNVDIAAALSTGTIDIFLGNGDGTFQSPRTISFSGTAVGLVAGKFAGSSSSDLALLKSANNSSGTVKLYASNGDGTFAAPKATSAELAPLVWVVGDANKDGKQDLVLCDRVNSYQVLLGRGDGTFQALASNRLNTSGGHGALALADYNADGNTERILPNEGDWTHDTGKGEIPSLLVLTGYGDGTFNNTGIADDAGNSGFGLAQDDFNNDGRPDLVVYNGLSSTVAMKLMSPGGRLVFPAIASYAVGGDIGKFVTLLTGDTNGDGKRDVLVVMQNGVQVLQGISGGYLSAPDAGDVRTYSLDLKSSNFDPITGTAGDLMIRGLDIGAGGDSPTETLYIAFGIGGANLPLRNVHGIYSSPSGATLGPLGIANFDQNGTVDLLIAQGVFFNNGYGQFTGPSPAPANIGHSTHSIADLATAAGGLYKDGLAG